MNRITRMLTMTGLGVVTAITMAGPAMAASSTGQGQTQTSASAQDSRRDRVVGVYNSRRACEFAGRIGERFNKWDDYDCEPRGWGFHRRWVLVASWDRWGGPWGHGRPGNWDHNRPGHGGWDHGRPGRPGGWDNDRPGRPWDNDRTPGRR